MVNFHCNLELIIPLYSSLYFRYVFIDSKNITIARNVTICLDDHAIRRRSVQYGIDITRLCNNKKIMALKNKNYTCAHTDTQTVRRLLTRLYGTRLARQHSIDRIIIIIIIRNSHYSRSASIISVQRVPYQPFPDNRRRLRRTIIDEYQPTLTTRGGEQREL